MARTCSRCIMDESVPDLRFDTDGIGCPGHVHERLHREHVGEADRAREATPPGPVEELRACEDSSVLLRRPPPAGCGVTGTPETLRHISICLGFPAPRSLHPARIRLASRRTPKSSQALRAAGRHRAFDCAVPVSGDGDSSGTLLGSSRTELDRILAAPPRSDRHDPTHLPWVSAARPAIALAVRTGLLPRMVHEKDFEC